MGVYIWGGISNNYKYLRWTITANRNNINVTQMSEFEICDNSGTKMVRPSGTTITGNIIGPSGEGVDKLIDGSTSTKYCPNGSLPIIITITLGTEIDLSVYNKYKRYTANDESGRDPKSWTIEVSEDGNNWVVVDTVTDANITTSRYALAYTGEMASTNPEKELKNAYIGEYQEGWQPGANTVAYYPLDMDFIDASGNSRNLTNNGGTITTLNGITCAYYNGSSYSMYNNYSLSNTARTISCWVCKSNNARIAVGVSDYNSTARGSLLIAFYQSYILVADNYGAQTFAETCSAGVWYYVTAVQEGSTVKGYLNGEFKGESTTRPNQIPTGWSLGAVHNTDHSEKYIGYISNVILEDKARTAQEIADYYNQTKSLYGIS